MVGVAEVRGPLTEELGVVFRLRDCRPSRPLGLLFAIAGGIVISDLLNQTAHRIQSFTGYQQNKLGFVFI